MGFNSNKLVGSTIVTLLSLLILSCGNDDLAPENGSIQIAPTGRSVNIITSVAPNCADLTGIGIAQEMVITVFDAAGRPMGDTSIELGITGYLILLADINGDGTVYNPDWTYQTGELQLNIGDPLTYSTTTDQDGHFIAYVETQTRCPHTSHLEVWSGSLYTNAEFEVTHEAPTP